MFASINGAVVSSPVDPDPQRLEPGPPTTVDLDTGPRDFTAFYEQTRASVARALALTLGDAELAGEAADEAMVRAYQRWRQVGSLDNPGGWVYRVGLNWSRSVLRRRKVARRHVQREIHTEQPTVGDPAVAAALDQLSVDHRAVVVCRHLLGWSEQQTADALQLPPGTVKSRLHRAMRELEQRLDHLDPRRNP